MSAEQPVIRLTAFTVIAAAGAAVTLLVGGAYHYFA